MWEILESIENSSFSTWVRESLFLYPTILAIHAVGMAFLVGLSAMISFRILGFGSSLPLAPMEKFFNLIYVSFWVNAVSGILLASLALVNFLTDPTFYIKLLAIVGAVVSMRLTRITVFGDKGNTGARPVPKKGRVLAAASLFFWAVAVVAGRLTAYSSYVEWRTAVAVLIALSVVLAGRFIGARVLFSHAPAEQKSITTSTVTD